jgi:hypothetical protein
MMACLTAAPAGAGNLATNAALAGQPYDQALTQQLGKPLCVLHHASAGTASYYFQSGHGATMTVVVNELRWAVDSSHVIAVNVAANTLLPNGCAGLTQTSLHNIVYELAAGPGHVRLGDSLEHVMQILGSPEASSRHDGLTHLEYSWDLSLYRTDHWTLSFNEGHLVEWTIRTLPVFFEVGS